MMRLVLTSLLLAAVAGFGAGSPTLAADPNQIVQSADLTLREIMAIPARSIPASLLAEAQGVAIIPDVIKVGFVAGFRRGQGVVLVRTPTGAWSLPQFITLTGGSVGWQAGVQGSDLVLVFMTQKSVQGLMRGKFTIGADAAASAGPIGRNAAAATDARLRAEILSYSRSRGLFVGLSLDGSAIEVDPALETAYYGVAPGQPTTRVPDSAMRLIQNLTLVSQVPAASPAQPLNPELAAPSAVAGGPRLAAGQGPTAGPSTATIRQALVKSTERLNATVDEPWQRYLALPREVFEGNTPPRVESLQAAIDQYDKVIRDSKYQTLAQSPEFQSTYELLRQYTQALSAAASTQLTLPPPPGGG